MSGFLLPLLCKNDKWLGVCFFFFLLSLSLVTWAVCMVCQETTVPQSLPEPPMWPLSSDSSWSLWISTGTAPAPSSSTRSFSVKRIHSQFSEKGSALLLLYILIKATQPPLLAGEIVLTITYQNLPATQWLTNLHFSYNHLPCFSFFGCTVQLASSMQALSSLTRDWTWDHGSENTKS